MDMPLLNAIYPKLTSPSEDVAKGMAEVMGVLFGRK